MHFFLAKDTTWADSSNLYCAHSFAMASSQEVDMHRDVSKENLDRESCSWNTISSFVDDQSEVVDLEQHAEVYQRAKIASYQHSGLAE